MTSHIAKPRLGNLLPYLSLSKEEPARKTGFMKPGPYSKIVVHIVSDVDLELSISWSNRPNDLDTGTPAVFLGYDSPRFVNGNFPTVLTFPIEAEFLEFGVEFQAPEGSIFSMKSFGIVL